MANHTPGPWRIKQKRSEMIDINHSNGDVPGAISLTLAKVVARETWQAEAEANARLIAAAPEMLEALRHALDTLDKIDEDYSLLLACYERQHLRKIIAKATGETE